MIFQGLTLTIVGMSVVFVFLTLLVYIMKLLSTIVLKFARESQPSGRKQTVQKSAQPAARLADDAEIAAAIAAVSVFTNN